MKFFDRLNAKMSFRRLLFEVDDYVNGRLISKTSFRRLFAVAWADGIW